jgi:hypothetical protein
MHLAIAGGLENAYRLGVLLALPPTPCAKRIYALRARCDALLHAGVDA